MESLDSAAKTTSLSAIAAAIFFFLGLLVVRHAAAQVEYVDPTIGNVGILLVPTRPSVYLPNSMVRVYPIRADAMDDRIESFPLTISSHRQPELFSIMPGDGKPAAYDQEQTTPYYYSTRFDDSQIRAVFTPTERCGYWRFSFPKGSGSVVLANRQPGSLHAEQRGAVSGEESVDGLHAYFYGEFSAPVSMKAESADGKSRMIVTAQGQTLEFRYGISFINAEQAQKNLRREIPEWGFERVKDAAKTRWNQTLGRITVEGGTEAQKKVFYTALYRSFERMINISEDSQYYSAFDHKVHQDPRPFYVDNWLWDTFRALEPLQTLLNPDVQADKIQSYVRMYQQSGIMPTFALAQGNNACMNGNHAAPWFADAWFKGVRNFDLATAYEGVRKRSLEDTLQPWRLGPKGPLDDFYNAHGYMPALRPGEKETDPHVHPFEKRQPVPVTLENSLDDWEIAQLARELKKPDDEKLFLGRAANYRNLFRVDKGMMWPKDAGGQWIEPLDPKFSGGMGGRDYYDENNGYTYTWDVAQDFSGLIDLMGGTAKAEANLDQLFREPLGRSKYEFQAKFPDSTSMVGQFSMGNEPSLAIPYIYNRLGAPWKTQKRVRMLLESFFTDTLQGIPGDEDGGGMSAFVVFSMLGFYPVTPGIPTYDVGSPVFQKATIHLKNGKDFVIVARNASRDNKYVQEIRLNGRELNQVWFRHADIADGGTLEVTMGNTPNLKLGSDPKTFPPDSITAKPEDFVQ
ncbi:GH92 family glycosyl hydrolase [Occallatibacter riparius]|uniref:GH92 family glycosyl hydrolase n=1 Tax=Occallatibacter riparius TaxID=1002689 RepID=A0A9J7BT94_9BACT|nr:GH92 family glycosyl hydrolase [Occallatibacter riparius]UWZ86092.1 GH92 family glycosyl hydrolase [Occallatibacter riparius]